MSSNNNLSQFIVQIFQYDVADSKWQYIEDGFALILEKSYGPTLVVRSKEKSTDIDNVNYLDAIISEDLNYEYKDSENNSGYTARFNVFDKKIGIKFDDASSQAFEEFKIQLSKQIDTKYKTLYYDSGNLQYSGQFVEDDVTGTGTEFFDTPEQKVKYHGELEDNLYDGAGNFYSCDGGIEIIANNISRGLPNGKVKLIIHRKDKDNIIKTFDYRSQSFDVLPGDVNFCEIVARYFYPDIDKLFFESYSLEEKVDELNKKLDMILSLKTMQEINMERANRGLIQKFFGVFWN